MLISCIQPFEVTVNRDNQRTLFILEVLRKRGTNCGCQFDQSVAPFQDQERVIRLRFQVDHRRWALGQFCDYTPMKHRYFIDVCQFPNWHTIRIFLRSNFSIVSSSMTTIKRWLNWQFAMVIELQHAISQIK